MAWRAGLGIVFGGMSSRRHRLYAAALGLVAVAAASGLAGEAVMSSRVRDDAQALLDVAVAEAMISAEADDANLTNVARAYLHSAGAEVLHVSLTRRGDRVVGRASLRPRALSTGLTPDRFVDATTHVTVQRPTPAGPQPACCAAATLLGTRGITPSVTAAAQVGVQASVVPAFSPSQSRTD